MSEPKKSTVFQIYCINLKERSDRWKRFSSQPGFQKLTYYYNFERFEGVNGKLLDVKNDTRVSLRTKRNITYQKRRDHEDLDTVGGVGCYLSHMGCWQRFLQSSSQYALIFEDDAEIPIEFKESLELALEQAEQEDLKRPEIWLLSRPWGPTMRKILEVNDVKYEGDWAQDVTGPLTGYVLSRGAAKILLKNALPIDGHVDHYMHRCAQMGLVTISHNKNIILRQVGVIEKDSDIQQKPSCEICNLPDAPSKKGYIIITNQTVSAVTVAIVSIGALFALRAYSNK